MVVVYISVEHALKFIPRTMASFVPHCLAKDTEGRHVQAELFRFSMANIF